MAHQTNISDLPGSESQDTISLFSGGGEMGALMRSFDWTASALGPPGAWSPTLQAVTRMVLANSFPMLLWWGPDFLQLYNDAYRPVLGDKHPHAALGRPFRECWAEVFHVLGPLAQRPFEGGPATLIDDIPLEINRFGFMEESHFTIGYSAVPDPQAASGIGGVLATVHEITEKVVGDRRTLALRDLSTRAFEAKSAQEACDIAAATLANYQNDIPFAVLYLVDPGGDSARLASACGIEDSSSALGETVSLSPGPEGAWRLAECREQNQAVVVDDLEARFVRVPPGPWSDPPRTAAVVPINSNLALQPVGFLVAGISSRLLFNDSYRGFLELVSTQIASAIANARAYEDERRRNQALEELDRAKTTFFSNVSHEFRTPLTLMIGPIEDALRGADDPLPMRRESLEMVHRNGIRLLKLVNTLLDFSRIESGRREAVYEPVDLALLSSELASTFRSLIEGSGLEYRIECPPVEEPVYVDREMWEKIVLNLLSNAFKFTLKGSIDVRLQRIGNEIEFRVQDSGCGIADEDLPHIFERFYRVKNAGGRSFEGSGIGLALVRELVRLNGGRLRVDSRMGRGSTFTVSLPLGRAHLPQEKIGRSQAPLPAAVRAHAYLEEALHWVPEEASVVDRFTASTPLKSPGARARVVLADDNRDMRDYLKRLLGESYDVEAFSDGESALASVLGRPPDLVVTDVMMPGLDGLGLLARMREVERTASIPVIILSARAGDERRLDGVLAGADDYLVKPFSARELVARVENHLALSHIRREAERRIRESEGRFRALVAASSYTIYRMSPDWKEMRQLRGSGFLAETEASNPHWLEQYILPEDQPFVLRAIQVAIRKKEIFELEHRVRRLDGGVGWTLSRAIPVLNEQGGIEEWFGTASDISDRKSDEESRSRLAAIVDSADDAIVSKDLNGIIRSWNEGASRMFGYAPEEIIGRSILTLIPENLRYEEEDILRMLRAGERVDHYETVRTKKDGTKIEVSITISPIRDGSGRVVGASKIARDISDRKRIESLLLQNEKLGATGRMAASIAHEINNPLESLMNLIYLARRESPSEGKAYQYLRTAEEELERVSHIARQTLGFYRDTSAPTEVFLHDLIESVLTVYNSKLLAAGISADLRFHDRRKVVASKGELLQIFSNVVANAIDAMPRGGILAISTRQSVFPEGDGMEVLVRDTGMGIEPGNLPRIFEPFFTTKGDRGTGIGLWVARQLLSGRGGHIVAESSVIPGQTGTTIRLFIPFSLPTRTQPVID